MINGEMAQSWINSWNIKLLVIVTNANLPKPSTPYIVYSFLCTRPAVLMRRLKRSCSSSLGLHGCSFLCTKPAIVSHFYDTSLSEVKAL